MSDSSGAEKLPPGVHPPLPENKFSLHYATELWAQVRATDVREPAEAEWVIEALRVAGEIAVWGDKNDEEVADYLIMECMMVGHIMEVIDTPRLAAGIYVQCIQTVVIMLQNHTRESTLFFILSNGTFNRIIEAKLDYSNDEIVSHYVSFLKSVTSRLTSKNILPLFCNGGSFPLLASAMNSALLTHDDRMVRTSVRQVIGQMLRINDPAVTQFAQGCVPRLVDDLGAFLEAQLRNLSLLVDDEGVSMMAVEMNDEDIADDGLYLIDLLAGCRTDEERLRMARTMRDYVLERLLLHAQDSDGADVIVSTIVFMFLSRWLRQAPKWFIECVLSAEDKRKCSTAGAGAAAAASAAAAPVLTQSLSWALFAAPSVHSGLTPQREQQGGAALAASASGGANNIYDSRSHPPASTVTRAAICVLATVFDKLTDGKPSEWDTQLQQRQQQQQDGEGATCNGAVDGSDASTLTALVQLLANALVGMSERVDRTSAYNCAALFHLARQVLRPGSAGAAVADDPVRAFFDRIVLDSDLLAAEQSPLRLELLIVVDSLAKQGAPLFAEAALSLGKARDQWPGFIDELRFPLKRQLKFREPISQQERVTHRACVIASLRAELLKGNTQRCDALAQQVLLPPGSASGHGASDGAAAGVVAPRRKPATVTGNLVNEDVSPEGGLPAVFLSIDGNVLKIIRVEFATHGGFLASAAATSPASLAKGGGKAAGSGFASGGSSRSTAQILPIVALSLTQDVSRPFVLHFCSPLCCGVAPFSVSFPSRAIAAQVQKVLTEAATKLRERVRTELSNEMSQR